eukprot:TRINITY_DN11198_c0_g1_i1.p1 TRINITY_DN11198_c0_g1~~TRINITY_DN11198_c0_g1_i1.p1  ORF type:complete len:167 (+),score=30.59 TRINITY_DN11198_c0_g1_i1:104-604(+)
MCMNHVHTWSSIATTSPPTTAHKMPPSKAFAVEINSQRTEFVLTAFANVIRVCILQRHSFGVVIEAYADSAVAGSNSTFTVNTLLGGGGQRDADLMGSLIARQIAADIAERSRASSGEGQPGREAPRLLLCLALKKTPKDACDSAGPSDMAVAKAIVSLVTANRVW